jgi:hypothetical protein
VLIFLRNCRWLAIIIPFQVPVSLCKVCEGLFDVFSGLWEGFAGLFYAFAGLFRDVSGL